MLDLVIRGARIVDGTGAPSWRGDIGLRGSTIAEIGQGLECGAETIDADGRVVAPGFIDMHSHSDLAVLRTPLQEMKISQGVCTELVAQDGLGCAPVREASKQRIAELVAGLVGEVDEWSWSSVGEYLDQIDRAAAVNLAALAPHATIRSDYLGGEDRPATEQELDAMSRAVDDAMRDGAFGLSTGLEYEPTTAASTAELIRLAAAARRHGGIYITHLRDYDLHFRAALAEAVEICRSASIPLHYSHFHCYGRRNFGLGAEICQGAERATNQAAGVSFDIYPYTTGTTYAHWFLSRDSQRRTIPALKEAMRSREGRAGLIDALDREGMPVDIGWEDCYPGAGGELIDARGKSLAELSVERSEHPAELLMQLVERSNFTATMNCVMTHADDVDGTIHHPLATVGSDAILHGGGVHPRGWGSFAKVIRLYVEERRSMTIEQAVALMSGRPARRLGLRDRGVIRPGAVADLAVFDPASVRDEATYAHPTKVARGFDLVFVGGRPVWRDGAATGETPGRALRSSAGRGGGAARASVQGPGRTHPDWARWVRGARRGDSRRDRGS